jgi:hypothetical protein
VVFLWIQHLHSLAELSSWQAASMLAVDAVGIERLLADGNPTYPANFAVRPWAQTFLQAPGPNQASPLVARLHSLVPALIGPASASGTAGEQYDSVFTGGEGLTCPPAAQVVQLSAWKLAARPVHHLEADGSQLDASRHLNPRLVLWDGRAHWHTGVSPDRLGKLAGLSVEQASGWWGPDVEHAMFAGLAAGARYTGSPACQHMLGNLARIYPLQWTTNPQLVGNSQPFAARAVGWEGILAVHLWRELADRALAERVRAHYVQRAAMVLVPKLGTAPPEWTGSDGVYPSNVWDARKNDPRLGTGWWYMPWQQSLGAYGADLAGAQFNLPALRAIALAAARRVLAEAVVSGGANFAGNADELERYREYTIEELGALPAGTDAVPEFTTRAYMPLTGGGVSDSSFNHYGMPLAACVVLRHEASVTAAEAAKARAFLQQVRASATETKHTRWLAPGVQ